MSDDKRDISSNSAKNEHEKVSLEKNQVVFYDTKTDYGTEKKAAPVSCNTPPQPVKRKIPRKRLIINIAAIFLAAVMLVIGTGCVITYGTLSSYNYMDIDTSTHVEEISQTSAVKPTQNSQVSMSPYEGKLLNDQQILNILIIGADTRYNQDRGNSDTMILVSIDTKNKKLKLLSFMRDTYVAIPGYEDNKLTASFSLGGAQLTVRTVQMNYGIQIDRYVIVDFKSFKNIIDKLGGLDIELTQEEVDYIDWQTWKNNQADTRNELNAYSYTYKPNSEGVEVAKVHLNGRQALWHARNRGEDGICSGDDYVRTERQRNVISIMINDLKKSDITTLMNIVYDIGPMITTNFKATEITSLATNITKYLKYDIISQSAPDYNGISVDFTYEDLYVNGEIMNCIVITDWEEFRDKISKYVFENENLLKVS